MRGRPLIVWTIAWMVGSSIAYECSGLRLLMIWSGMTLLLAIPALLHRNLLRSMLIAWVALTLSGIYWEWSDARNVTVLPEAVAMDIADMGGMLLQSEGVIASSVDVDGDRADLQVELKKVMIQMNADTGDTPSSMEPLPLHEQVMVQVKLQSKDQQRAAGSWQRGDRIKLNGTVEIPSTARNFGGFDYAAYLRTQHIHWLYKVKGIQNVQTSPPSHWSTLTIFRWNDRVRSGLGSKIAEIFQEPHAGYMKGLLIGMQDDIDPETYTQFSQLGLTHILAISGMHVAVYVASLLFLLSLFKVSKERSLLIVMIMIPVYVLISGVSPSVVRAGIMGMIGLFAARKGWLKDGMNILAAAALLMMLWNPYYMLSVSFQLSFLVTAGLMLYVPLVTPLLRFLPKRFAAAAGVTLVAQVVSFPLTIYYFNQFSLLSFAANFVLVPLITFLTLPLGAAALLLGWIWLPAGRSVGWIAEMLNDGTFWLVRWMNGYPQFVTIWRSPSIIWILAYFAVLYLLLYVASRYLIVQKSRLPAGDANDTVELEGVGSPGRAVYSMSLPSYKISSLIFTIMLVFIFLIYWEYRPLSLHGAGLVQFLDVGQGDSILITTPGGRNILVDGGGTVNFRKPQDTWKERKNPFEVGAKVVVPLLKQRGIHHLDAVIITHGDQDHAGGIQAVLDQIPVKALLFNGTLAGTSSFDKLMDTALHRKIPVYAVHQGMQLKMDDHTDLSFLSPLLEEMEQDEVPVEKNQNHISVAFLLTMNDGRFLFTGDMDKAAEEDILSVGMKNAQAALTSQSSMPAGAFSMPEGSVDVIKIAHHGSKSSSSEDWLHYWRPRAAVISAGVNNLYGHPHADVVERIAAEKAQLFRTDLSGEVQMIVQRGKIQTRFKLDLIH
ncbi:ComEC/Rec2 family competence protein [Paenibacillus dokdonensis]|uniref:ComEC/Rec2 family competence protein n=1 Tax=Paenibacillus dokdonensis TaxID=2567944 RepID=A0ABU6GY23_9BACL|nr:ComEC/Rec2 family competence protein [Paenibacillus dokdonensis]MEC0243082.1 ComEC/Rec2 family competence protein [Paenibacillus dokdonensis]